MYKTVRHGENSLQYTILPQTEEVLSNSGLKGKGRDYSPGATRKIHVRTTRRKTTVKFIFMITLGMVLALGVASIIPFYVMNGALFARQNQLDHHETVTSPGTAPLAPTGRELAKSRKKELKISPDVVLTLGQKSETTTSPSTTASAVPSTISHERPITRPWTMPAFRSWRSSISTTIPPIPTEDNEIPPIGTPASINHYPDTPIKPWEKDIIIRPTVAPEPVTIRNVLRYYSQAFVPSEKTLIVATKSFDDVLITTKGTTTRAPITTEFGSKLRDLKDDMLSAEDDDELRESLEVDEVFSLPPLKPDFAGPDNDSDEVTMSKTGDSTWYGARWPFVDTSSSIQWTVYNLGDNLLLPLLIAAMSSIALVFLLALAVRRRKRTYAASAQTGKLSADPQADDNTNLLTAENAEDADE